MFGRVGAFCALVTSALAGQPGAVPPEVSQAMIAAAAGDTETIEAKLEGRGAADFIGVIQRMIPTNIVAAAGSNGDMLAVIFFSLLFGFALTRMDPDRQSRMLTWWDDVYEVMIRITDWIIGFTPYGVFALVTATVAKSEGEVLYSQ